MDAQSVAEEWAAALDDAGLSSSDCVLLFSDLPPKSGRGAQWCEPGIEMKARAEDDLLSDELVAEVNAPEHLPFHRIILRRVRDDDRLSVARFSAKLRHELEHARQWTECGPPPNLLSELADEVLGPKLLGLPSGNVFTNLKPTEQDANAASAMFLRARFPESVEEVLNHRDDAPLARSLTPPAPTATLVRRMVALLYVYEDLCVALATRKGWTGGFAYHLDDFAQAPGATKLWKALETTPIKSFWDSGGPPPLRPSLP
jgi:hypothetical protein